MIKINYSRLLGLLITLTLMGSWMAYAEVRTAWLIKEYSELLSNQVDCNKYVEATLD